MPNIPFPSIPTTTKISLLGAVVGLALLGAFVLYETGVHNQPPAQFPAVLTLAPERIEARAAIVYDPVEQRILFQKNAAVSLPLASLTKLMSAETVLRVKNVNVPLTITLADLAPQGDWGFRAGDTVSLSDLIKMALVASSNDAMAAAAASLGGDYMNQLNRTAGMLGLSNTYFLNPTGLDLSEETAGAYGSAYDVARLAAAFMRGFPQYFELTANDTISIQDDGRVLTATSTALPLHSIPGFIGAKTGYTRLAGGNLVAAFDVDIGHPLIVVVLGSSEEGRFTDIETLIHAIRSSATTTLL